MKITAMICPQCGAKIDFSEDKMYSFCPFCATPLVFEKETADKHAPAIETKIVQSAPVEGKELQEIIDFESIFGWDYKDQDYHKTEEIIGNEKEITEWITITFQRDNSSPWVTPELMELEKEYNQKMGELEKIDDYLEPGIDDWNKSEELMEKNRLQYFLVQPANWIGLALSIVSIFLRGYGSFFNVLLIVGVFVLLVGLIISLDKLLIDSRFIKKHHTEEIERKLQKYEETFAKYAERCKFIENRCAEIMIAKFGKKPSYKSRFVPKNDK